MQLSPGSGLVVPANTPADIVQRLNAEVVRIGNLPDVRERLGAQGLTVTTTTPEESRQAHPHRLRPLGPCRGCFRRADQLTLCVRSDVSTPTPALTVTRSL